MTLVKIVLQALAEIDSDRKTDLLGQDLRDFSMKAIADKAQAIVVKMERRVRIDPKFVSRILSEDLGLSGRKRHPETRRTLLVYSEQELSALLARYGIEKLPPQQNQAESHEHFWAGH
jgi:hypothetical protein